MVSRAWQSIFGETGPRQDSMLPLLETSVFKVLPGIPAAQRIVTLPTIASHSRLPPPLPAIVPPSGILFLCHVLAMLRWYFALMKVRPTDWCN